MAPQSRGSPVPFGFQSKSTPNLPTLRSLEELAEGTTSASIGEPDPNPLSQPFATSPSEAASVEDNVADDKFELNDSSGSSSSSQEDSIPPKPPPQQPRRTLHTLHSSRSHTSLPPSASGLFPPFYNRPPTPLPPSPSLTSLLRPSFSTQTSRPTTPDSSDVEGGLNGTSTPTSTAAAVAKSARTATTVPRASPKVPTYEYYGFALYLASSAAFLMYLLWAYLPSPFLHQLGIHYYPNRWWALAVPAWLVMGIAYIYVALASYNTQYLTLPLKSIENLVDEAAQIAVVDKDGKIIRQSKGGRFDKKSVRGRSGLHSRNSSGGNRTSLGLAMTSGKEVDWRSLWNEGTDAVMDVPIGGVCEILYGTGRDEEDGDASAVNEAKG